MWHRDAELEQLRISLEAAGSNSTHIAELEAELTTAMSQVAVKVRTQPSYAH